jgi:CRP-like cAMP-binding protein
VGPSGCEIAFLDSAVIGQEWTMRSMGQDVETLQKIPLFQGLPEARVKLIAYVAEAVRFAAGEVIVQRGDPADAVYVITEGEASASVTRTDGRPVLLRTMGPGSTFGETSVLARGQRTAAVTARSSLETLKFSAKVFLELLESNADLALRVAVAQAERLDHLTTLVLQAPDSPSGSSV